MALDLSFSVTERNDNLVLTVTDTTGAYDAGDNTGGWGAPNPAVTDIDGTSHTLELSITITTSDGTSTTYDDIDLVDEFGDGVGPEFNNVEALVFALDCSMLEESGTALGTDEDQFPDGIYEITYIYDQGEASEVTETASALIDGQVRNAVYELLRDLTTIYNCKDCTSDTVLDAIFCRAYLDAMHSSAYVSKTEELLNQLAILERMVVDGTDYTWEE